MGRYTLRCAAACAYIAEISDFGLEEIFHARYCASPMNSFVSTKYCVVIMPGRVPLYLLLASLYISILNCQPVSAINTVPSGRSESEYFCFEQIFW